ncbi:hypothetical protein GCM10007979_04810 [Nocardioides albus]|nr:hypothetical protein GCM10007979_04810 [Nocardioides albus]
MSATITVAPLAASARAVAAPIPLAAPVTIAVLSVNSMGSTLDVTALTEVNTR